MKYPLPEGWKRGVMKTSKELVYINLVDGEIEISTEIEEMAHQMYLEKKAEMNQKNIFKKSPEKEKTIIQMVLEQVYQVLKNLILIRKIIIKIIL